MTTRQQGMVYGLIGVVIFGGSLPATRAAVTGLDPWFVTGARAVLAAAAGVLPLMLGMKRLPSPREFASLAVVAACVVLAYPLLSAIAVTQMPSARAILFTGLLPLATAGWATLRCGERPRPLFWLFAGLGAALVGGFALMNGADAAGDHIGDLLMLAAIALCGLGYAEGSTLSRSLGGLQVICWALLLAAPFMMALSLATWPASLAAVSMTAWIGLGYAAIFAMLIAFIFWYRGLALGGTAGVGQLQLLQPLIGFLITAWLLNEPVSAATVCTSLAVLACVAGARRFA